MVDQVEPADLRLDSEGGGKLKPILFSAYDGSKTLTLTAKEVEAIGAMIEFFASLSRHDAILILGAMDREKESAERIADYIKYLDPNFRQACMAMSSEIVKLMESVQAGDSGLQPMTCCGEKMIPTRGGMKCESCRNWQAVPDYVLSAIRPTRSSS